MRTSPESEQERSVERTVRWARRCREELDRRSRERGGADPPRIFAVVQGGGIESLRRQCADRPGRDRLRWLRLRRLAARRRRHAARRSDALGRRVAAARGTEARARDRPAGSRRQRLRARLLDLRLRAADPRRSPRPAVRVPATAGPTRRPAAGRRLLPRRPHPRSSRTGSTTDRSRRAATARSAPVTRRPTCITCSRSATPRPNGSRRSTTCASTCGSSSCSARASRRGRRPARRPRDRACPGSRCAHEPGAR